MAKCGCLLSGWDGTTDSTRGRHSTEWTRSNSMNTSSRTSRKNDFLLVTFIFCPIEGNTRIGKAVLVLSALKNKCTSIEAILSWDNSSLAWKENFTFSLLDFVVKAILLLARYRFSFNISCTNTNF